jgi:hypothetical protein
MGNLDDKVGDLELPDDSRPRDNPRSDLEGIYERLHACRDQLEEYARKHGPAADDELSLWLGHIGLLAEDLQAQAEFLRVPQPGALPSKLATCKVYLDHELRGRNISQSHLGAAHPLGKLHDILLDPADRTLKEQLIKQGWLFPAYLQVRCGKPDDYSTPFPARPCDPASGLVPVFTVPISYKGRSYRIASIEFEIKTGELKRFGGLQKGLITSYPSAILAEASAMDWHHRTVANPLGVQELR